MDIYYERKTHFQTFYYIIAYYIYIQNIEIPTNKGAISYHTLNFEIYLNYRHNTLFTER